jgi:signal recognition particle subunit SRP72
MAFVLQLLRYKDAASGIYKEVLKQKPADDGVVAVAQNNLASLNGTRELFESNKRMRASATDAVRAKLSSVQNETMTLNRCLLLLYLGKVSVSALP